MLWLLGSAEIKTSTEQALRTVCNDDMDLVFSSWPFWPLHLDACTFFATTSNNCLYITSMAYERRSILIHSQPSKSPSCSLIFNSEDLDFCEAEVPQPDTAIMNAIISIMPWDFAMLLLQEMGQVGSGMFFLVMLEYHTSSDKKSCCFFWGIPQEFQVWTFGWFIVVGIGEFEGGSNWLGHHIYNPVLPQISVFVVAIKCLISEPFFRVSELNMFQK